MNKKQLIVMWSGIIAICISNLFFLFFSIGTNRVFYDLLILLIWVFVIALITGGLIVTFKDKKPKDEKFSK